MNLKYSIDSWDKLPQCRSNLSSEYHIVVSDINCERYMKARLISVNHTKLGCVFATIVDGSGLLLDSSIPDMTRSEILNHLKKYGFIIQFTEKTEITEKQLYMLRGLYDMGYDYVRDISIVESPNFSHGYILAFNSSDRITGDWLNNWYSPSRRDLDSTIYSGSAYVIRDLLKEGLDGQDWSWVHSKVYRIADILSMYQSEMYSIDRRNVSEFKKTESK